MRRRRPAPTGNEAPSVVPLSRAHLVRDDSSDAAAEKAKGLDVRGGTRSRFGDLTPAVPAPPITGGGQRPTGPRAPARARRATGATQEYDGWTFVLIPPGAGARPRTLRVSVGRQRFVVASSLVLFGSTVATGGLLVLALSFMPPAQDEVRGIELGVFASGTVAPESLEIASTPAAIAAASAGASAPRATASRPRPAARPAPSGDDVRVGSGNAVSPSIMESLPVVGEITSRFARARRHPLLGVVRKHAGIDIAAPAGTHITAPAPGRVTFSGRKFGYGYTVDIDHGNGVVTRYAHCRSLVVRVGDEVAQGAVIATVGRSGLATAPHLHYEVRVHGRNVNPLRNPLASLLAGKQPAEATAAPPPPEDSALRAPPAPAIPDPTQDVPEVSFSLGDTLPATPTASTAPTRTSLLTAPIAGGIPAPVVTSDTTARKS